MTNNGISVILCCFNSINRLPTTLNHIANQIISDEIAWEIILVDNASTDDTIAVANKEWQKFSSSPPFRIVDQPQPGLSFAKFKGISEARYNYLLFCDDDNWLDKNYVSIAFETMESHPDAGIIGGQSTGFFEISEPFWFKSFSQSYAVEMPFPTSGNLPIEREYLAGAGMVIRKDLFMALQTVNFNPILTGRIGKSLMSGEDYELCLITKFMGFKIYYDERLHLTHYMPADRLTWKYCIQLTTYGQAIPEIYFGIYRTLFLNQKANSTLEFNKFYQGLLFKYFLELFRPRELTFNGIIKVPLRILYFAVSFPGSWEQVRFLSLINKLIFLILNKKKLQQKYTLIQEFINRIVIEMVNKKSPLSSINKTFPE
jgi:glycosyltransferase involved in cell wall biosynthesis